MTSNYDKQQLKAELVAALERDLALIEKAAQDASTAATEEESKPENDKDTRALEQSYLARGQAKRVVELREELALAKVMQTRSFGAGEKIAMSALIEVSIDDAERLLFIAPGGATRILGDGQVLVITTKSPVGRMLVGKCEGDDFALQIGGRVVEYEVVSVS